MYVCLFIALTFLGILILPVRPDLYLQLHYFSFYLESIVWAIAAIATGLLAYRSSLPGAQSYRLTKLFYVAVAVMAGSLLVRQLMWPPADSLSDELELFRGRCGLLILVISVPTWWGFASLIRRFAPVQLRHTSAWMALSMTSASTFLMQVICFQENPLHILIWHFLPTFALLALAVKFGPRLIRW